MSGVTDSLSSYDPLGRWLLATDADAFGHAGFVYTEGVGGVGIAVGGDYPLCVGVYWDDDALADGEELWFRHWDDDGSRSVRDAQRVVSAFLGSGRVWVDVPDIGTRSATLDDMFFVDDDPWVSVLLGGDASVEWRCPLSAVRFGVGS